MSSRNKRIVKEQKKAIKMDPEVAKVFKASTAVSTVRGTGSHLMKDSSKRRRGKQEIRDQKAAEEAKKASDDLKLSQFEAMQSQWEDMA